MRFYLCLFFTYIFHNNLSLSLFIPVYFACISLNWKNLLLKYLFNFVKLSKLICIWSSFYNICKGRVICRHDKQEKPWYLKDVQSTQVIIVIPIMNSDLTWAYFVSRNISTNARQPVLLITILFWVSKGETWKKMWLSACSWEGI